MPGLVVVLSIAAVARAASTDLEQAEEAYQRTDYKAALNTLLSVSPKNAAVYALIGKAYYMDGQYKNSTGWLEKAVAEDPRNSRYYDWLGRAYGRRAEESSFLTALPYANKTRDSFEKAVALDPVNLEALDDLFEYYLQAPGIVGGGVDKAEGVAARIGRLSEAESHYDARPACPETQGPSGGRARVPRGHATRAGRYRPCDRPGGVSGAAGPLRGKRRTLWQGRSNRTGFAQADVRARRGLYPRRAEPRRREDASPPVRRIADYSRRSAPF